MPLHLNIVSFDVPSPPDYGGVIDVYYKIRWLHAAGVKVHLHCFAYGRSPSPELMAMCEEVTCYPRKTGVAANLSLLPYTVVSRRSVELKKNLLKNGHPILFEVLHTCYLMDDADLQSRKRVFRHSNIEHEYYFQLAKAEKKWLRKIYHWVEGLRLWRFEKIVGVADRILAVNDRDTLYFTRKYPQVRAVYLPSFHGHKGPDIKPGKGDFVLVHGNLSVSENYEAVLWLLRNVLGVSGIKTIVAGLKPPEFLAQEIARYRHVTLVASPPREEMDRLISDAQVHVLYTAQDTGLKLKLLNVLHRGRFIVCNHKMISGTGLGEDETLRLVDDAAGYAKALEVAMSREFSSDLLDVRRQQLSRFSDDENGKKLMAEIF